MQNFILGCCAGLMIGTTVSYYFTVKFANRKIHELKDEAKETIEKTKQDAYKQVDEFYMNWRKNR